MTVLSRRVVYIDYSLVLSNSVIIQGEGTSHPYSFSFSIIRNPISEKSKTKDDDDKWMRLIQPPQKNYVQPIRCRIW